MTQGLDRRPAAADAFKQLHGGPELLILTNVWDAAGARVLVDVGVKAIATSSAAVAWSHGYPDGHALPVPLLIATARDITRVVTLPVTADIEGGYSDEPRAVGDTIAALIDVGIVGVNLEDGSGSPELLCAKIQAARDAAIRAGVALFINARTDVFLKKLVDDSQRVDEAIARANRYASAGADGIFVPGVVEAGAIEQLAAKIPRPLNIMARPGVPPARDLQRLGVRRLSAATWLARAALKSFADTATAFLAYGDSDQLAAASAPFVDYNGLFRPSS